MAGLKPITIVGGGLAGLTLGIGLRQKGIPVVIWEAGHYPRHRVCGEFISGRGREVLARLDLLEGLLPLFVLAQTAAFFQGRTASPMRPLPAAALCLSRFTLDAWLARHFQRLGGELRENARWPGEDYGEGLVRATGRRLQPQENGHRWVGLKVHARQVPLAADLEMHGTRFGYVGLCRLRDGEVNICGLFRLPPANAGSRGRSSSPGRQPAIDLLRGEPQTPLRERLAAAVIEAGSFCAIAGLSLRPQHATSRPECCVGDAITMIPPVTGNGMSMALEAAELAIEPLAAYAGGNVSWPEAREQVSAACDHAFARRLAWARCLHWMMFARALRRWPSTLALGSDLLWRLMFARTR